jgi:pre-rRNA-processing protein IPI3
LDELLRDHAFFVEPMGNKGSGQSDTASLKGRVSELESEIQDLREQLCRAKVVNDSMWDIVTQRLIKPSESKEMNVDDGAEEPKKN